MGEADSALCSSEAACFLKPPAHVSDGLQGTEEQPALKPPHPRDPKRARLTFHAAMQEPVMFIPA